MGKTEQPQPGRRPGPGGQLQLLYNIRDARSTKGAQRALLVALALRCDPKKGYLCWPSYRVLAQDTCYDEVTLKRAARALEEYKLIRRHTQRARSNRYYINAKLLAAQAAENNAQNNRESPDAPERALANALRNIVGLDDQYSPTDTLAHWAECFADLLQDYGFDHLYNLVTFNAAEAISSGRDPITHIEHLAAEGA